MFDKNQEQDTTYVRILGVDEVFGIGVAQGHEDRVDKINEEIRRLNMEIAEYQKKERFKDDVGHLKNGAKVHLIKAHFDVFDIYCGIRFHVRLTSGDPAFVLPEEVRKLK